MSTVGSILQHPAPEECNIVYYVPRTYPNLISHCPICWLHRVYQWHATLIQHVLPTSSLISLYYWLALFLDCMEATETMTCMYTCIHVYMYASKTHVYMHNVSTCILCRIIKVM